MPPGRRRRLRRLGIAAAAVCAALACETTAVGPSLTDWDQDGVIARLGRPLPGTMGALYRLRVPATGGLRLAVAAVGVAGRLTVSEQFGSTLSITAWDGEQPPLLLDFREGCRLEAEDVSAVIGVGRLPLPQAVRLLGGRLPAVSGDRVTGAGPGRLRVDGDGWACLTTLEADPWRVVEVSADSTTRPWRVRLDRHSGSVPGRIRVERGEAGDWAELELVHLEWDATGDLPDLPDLPPCH